MLCKSLVSDVFLGSSKVLLILGCLGMTEEATRLVASFPCGTPCLMGRCLLERRLEEFEGPDHNQVTPKLFQEYGMW